MKKITFSVLIAAPLILMANMAFADAVSSCVSQAASAKKASIDIATTAYNTAKTLATQAKNTALTNANSTLKYAKDNATKIKTSAFADADTNLKAMKAQATQTKTNAVAAANSAYSQAITGLTLDSQKDPYAITRDLTIYDASANYAQAVYLAATSDVTTRAGISHTYIVALGNAKINFDTAKESATANYNSAIAAATQNLAAAKAAAQTQYTAEANTCQPHQAGNR
jgi:hypothetical protein